MGHVANLGFCDNSMIISKDSYNDKIQQQMNDQVNHDVTMEQNIRPLFYKIIMKTVQHGKTAYDLMLRKMQDSKLKIIITEML